MQCSRHMIYCVHGSADGGDEQMPAVKMVYVSVEAHQHLRLLAARRNRSMGMVVEDLVNQELADLVNPWTGAEGLLLQQRALAAVWDDRALDVYDHD